MRNGGSVINMGDISRPATVLIEKISEAIGGVFKPYQIRRVAEAEGQAEKIREVARLEITDLQRRALHRFICEEAQKQANIENITQKALPEVSQDARPQDVQNDWITNFFDQCRLISDEEMQRLWAKVLAGEANRPGTHSKRTVGLLSSLDKSDAELFKKFCTFCWCFGEVNPVGEATPTPVVYDFNADIYKKVGVTFTELTHLNDIGLIHFETYSGFGLPGRPQKIVVFYYGTAVIIEFPKPKDNSMETGHVLLTKAGKELARLCDSQPHGEYFKYVVKKWRKEGLMVEVRKARRSAAANGAQWNTISIGGRMPP